MRSLRHIVKTQTPSEAQKNYGNYRKLHYHAHGLRFSIENPRGSIRSGVDPNGDRWSRVLTEDYGGILGTSDQTRDGDALDCFLSPTFRTSKFAHIIDQIDPTTGLFDEHKVMIGWDSPEEAKRAYLSNYARGWKGLGDLTTLSMESFKLWLKSGKKLDTAGYVVKKAFAMHSKGYANHILKTASVDWANPLTWPKAFGALLKKIKDRGKKALDIQRPAETNQPPSTNAIPWGKDK